MNGIKQWLELANQKSRETSKPMVLQSISEWTEVDTCGGDGRVFPGEVSCEPCLIGSADIDQGRR